ncbi:hypothetical protein QTP86_001761 [Hemibagrus guttatus]|nr:hypothetical protein QTP86_001761 [Hemibagrus guttatus]
MWQCIQSITNYRPAPPACDSDASLPDALNSVYARFEAQDDMTARKTIPPLEDQVLCLTTADVRRAQSDHSPLNINRSNVEIVKSTKFLGVPLVEDLTWSLNTSSITKKAQQHLYFLRRLRKAHLPPLILTTFYRETIKSILSSYITAWFGNCTSSDRKTLQWVVRTAEKIIRVSLPSITDMYTVHCIRKAKNIVDDPTHPLHTLFTLLPSGKRYRSIRALTTRLLNSFFPQAIRCLNRELN